MNEEFYTAQQAALDSAKTYYKLQSEETQRYINYFLERIQNVTGSTALHYINETFQHSKIENIIFFFRLLGYKADIYNHAHFDYEEDYWTENKGIMISWAP